MSATSIAERADPSGPSVVITCYNLERYIAEAIRSVLDQEPGAGAAEIIVVDDCSTDASADVIRGFPGVRYLRTPRNSGVLLAMLHGIDAAGSDVVLFLDGDDVWEPSKLRRSWAAFKADPELGLLTHDLSFIDADGEPITRASRPAAVLSPMPREAVGEAVRHGILTFSDHVWLGSALAVRRSTADLTGFAAWARGLPDPRNTYQDWPLAYWAAARPRLRLGYLPESLFRYRLHGANHSGDASSVDKALRNLRRARNTSEAILDIARTARVAPRYRRIAERLCHLNRYLVGLYEGRRVRALAGFARSLPFLLPRPTLLAKEVVRLTMVATMGTARFTRWRSAR